jgi:hypothetical protein
MTDTQIEIREMKETIRRMQAQIDMIEKHCKSRSYKCIDLVPSTQAFCNEKLYDRE